MMIKEGSCNTTLREAAEEAAGRREQCRGGAAVVTLGVFAGGRGGRTGQVASARGGNHRDLYIRQTGGSADTLDLIQAGRLSNG